MLAKYGGYASASKLAFTFSAHDKDVVLKTGYRALGVKYESKL